jgi:hypothetical protein
VYGKAAVTSTTAGGSLPLREVIAFPKSTGGNDLLVGAPSALPQEVLEQYHIRVSDAKVKAVDAIPSISSAA